MCIQTSWLNIQFKNAYPPIPLQSRVLSGTLPPSFTNPFDISPYTTFICIVRPPANDNNIVVTLQYPFANSYDATQNTTFFGVPQIEAGYGELANFSMGDSSVSNTIFFTHVPGKPNGTHLMYKNILKIIY